MKKRFALVVWMLVFSCAAFAQTASATRRRAVRHGLPTSGQLIEAARGKGAIDDETALVYRVYAAFGDCRVPAEFRGDDTDVTDSPVMMEVAARFSSLSAATQEKLLPYLRQPLEPGGWLEMQQIMCGGGGMVRPSAVSVKNIEILGGKVIVTYLAGRPDDAKAQEIATAIETTIYPRLTALMGEPLPYGDRSVTRWLLFLIPNLAANGKVVPGVTQFVNPQVPAVNCKSAPVYSKVDPRNSSVLASVTHELMLAILYRFELSAPCYWPEYMWIGEATATWAEDFVYPNPPPPPTGDHEHGSAKYFLDRPELSLDYSPQGDDLHANGAYLLPFFIHRRFNDASFVRRIWEASAQKLSLDAVDDALGPHGHFREQWREFVLRNWNREPYKDYEVFDKVKARAYFTLRRMKADPDERFDMAAEDSRMLDHSKAFYLEPLSARYFHFQFEESSRTLTFLNGARYKLSLRPFQNSEGSQFVLDNPAKKREGLNIQALLKINGVWETKPRDWTDEPYVQLCREESSERVDELVIIYSNSDYKNRDPITSDDRAPVLWASNISCSTWKIANATMEETAGAPFIKQKFEATFKRVPTPPRAGGVLPVEGLGVPPIVYEGTGVVEWTIQTTVNGCVYSGGGTLPLQRGLLATYNSDPPQSGLYRAYGVVLDTGNREVNYSITCGNTTIAKSAVYDLFIFPRDFKVKAEGTTISDEQREAIGKSKWTILSDPPP